MLTKDHPLSLSIGQIFNCLIKGFGVTDDKADTAMCQISGNPTAQTIGLQIAVHHGNNGGLFGQFTETAHNGFSAQVIWTNGDGSTSTLNFYTVGQLVNHSLFSDLFKTIWVDRSTSYTRDHAIGFSNLDQRCVSLLNRMALLDMPGAHRVTL